MKRLSTKARKAARRLFKARLWQEQLGLCYWCGRDIVLMNLPAKAKDIPGNLATFDHLDDRFSPERGKHEGKIRTVLACSDCNNRRGQESEAAQPIEELWRRAGNGPQEMRS